jgi:hypothetical protein
MIRTAAILAGLLVAGAADAAEIPLPPGAVLAADDAAAFATVPLPAGPWSGGPPQTVDAEGAVLRRAWRIPDSDRTTDELVAPIRDRLEADGFAVLYSCADRACGGYDFRFGLDLLPAPAMYVDLGDFRYLLAAEDGTAGRRLVSVVASRGLGAGYVHVTTVDPADAPATAVPLEAARPGREASRRPRPCQLRRPLPTSPSGSCPTVTPRSRVSSFRPVPPRFPGTAMQAFRRWPRFWRRTLRPPSFWSVTPTPSARSTPTRRCRVPERSPSGRA